MVGRLARMGEKRNGSSSLNSCVFWNTVSCSPLRVNQPTFREARGSVLYLFHPNYFFLHGLFFELNYGNDIFFRG